MHIHISLLKDPVMVCQKKSSLMCSAHTNLHQLGCALLLARLLALRVRTCEMKACFLNSFPSSRH